jgi:hypothetical protein
VRDSWEARERDDPRESDGRVEAAKYLDAFDEFTARQAAVNRRHELRVIESDRRSVEGRIDDVREANPPATIKTSEHRDLA